SGGEVAQGPLVACAARGTSRTQAPPALAVDQLLFLCSGRQRAPGNTATVRGASEGQVGRGRDRTFPQDLPVQTEANARITHIPQFPRAVSGNFAYPANPRYFGHGGSLPVTKVTQKGCYTSSAYCVQCPRIAAISSPKLMPSDHAMDAFSC